MLQDYPLYRVLGWNLPIELLTMKHRMSSRISLASQHLFIRTAFGPYCFLVVSANAPCPLISITTITRNLTFCIFDWRLNSDFLCIFNSWLVWKCMCFALELIVMLVFVLILNMVRSFHFGQYNDETILGLLTHWDEAKCYLQIIKR